MQNKKVLAILLAMMMFLTACGTTPESGNAASNGDADLPTINWTVQSCDNAGTARYVSLEYSEVADYIIEPCPHMAACSIQGQLVVNKESWAELPVEYQNILKELIDENRALAFEYAVEQDKIAEENFKKDGVEIIYLSDEDIAAMKVMGAECLAAYWDASKLCTEYLERYVTFMRDNGFGTVADTIEAARK